MTKPVEAEKTFPPYIVPETTEKRPHDEGSPPLGEWAKDSDEVKLPLPVLRPPRKPFAEVLAAFMEQSNIRWGEIIGGVLIIDDYGRWRGCRKAVDEFFATLGSRAPLLARTGGSERLCVKTHA